MSVQKYNAFEKSSIQTRHSVKRLEMFIETTRDEHEKKIAEEILTKFKEIRKLIPGEFQDPDLKEKE